MKGFGVLWSVDVIMVGLASRFLSLDCFVFVYKDVHVGCFNVYKKVL